MSVQILEAHTLLSIPAQDGSGDRFEIVYSVQNGRLVISTIVLGDEESTGEQTRLSVPLPKKFIKK